LRVSVVGAVEEEAASSKGAYHVVNTWPAPDYAVIGEPSGWRRVTLGYKGRLLVHYTLERSMSHTAGEARGACQQAVDYWLGVRAWAEAFNADRTGRFDTLDPSLRHIHSESDGLSERVEMQLGLRLPLGLDLDALEAHLLASRGPAEIALSGREVPFRAHKRTPLASAFLAAIRGQGGQPAFVTKTGTSDMNVLGPRWGCPIVAYGPGDSSLDHTPDEHLDLEEYLRAIRVLEDVLRRVGS
ncbi:MAG: M20/M25/M40 family metallo-hydrolase, partial [Anaerolineae bacterium]|nr:M20/M25/M40 family metallo-hydrolase [Anaerolineae bacterium]